MSLPRTPVSVTPPNVKVNSGASPSLQTHPTTPPPQPPQPEPPDKATASSLSTSQDLDPSKMLPQSFFDTVLGSGTKRKAYSLTKLKEIMNQIKIYCKDNHSLPLPSNFSSEVAHYVSLDPITHQILLDHIKENPLQIFSFTKEKLCADKNIKDDSFIFWADQLWFRKHQLSAPLFEISSKFMQLTTTEVDQLLNKFTRDLRNYPQTFLTYKGKSFRINRASINSLLDKINQDSTEINLPDYISSFFYFLYNFLQTHDDKFDEQHCIDIFMQISRQFKSFFELDDPTWNEIFTSAQFTNSFKFIADNHLFSAYAKVISHPYQDLKLTLLRDLSNIKQHTFDYSFFITQESDFSSDTDIFDEEQQKMLPPLIQELMFSEKQLNLGSGKQVRFTPLIQEVRSLHISDSNTPNSSFQSQTPPDQFPASAPQFRRGRSGGFPVGGGGGSDPDGPGGHDPGGGGPSYPNSGGGGGGPPKP